MTLIEQIQAIREERDRLKQENEDLKTQLETAETVSDWMNNLDLFRMQVAEGKLDGMFRGPFVRLLSELLVSWFVRGTDAVNCIQWRVTHEATGDLEFTVQRIQGKTPMELREEAEMALRTERAERMTVEDELASLRARVKEYLAAIDFDDDETAPPDLCEACQRTERAKAALRAEVSK